MWERRTDVSPGFYRVLDMYQRPLREHLLYIPASYAFRRTIPQRRKYEVWDWSQFRFHLAPHSFGASTTTHALLSSKSSIHSFTPDSRRRNTARERARLQWLSDLIRCYSISWTSGGQQTGTSLALCQSITGSNDESTPRFPCPPMARRSTICPVRTYWGLVWG